MKYYTKILVWENTRRLEKLNKFRGLVLEYFNDSRYNWKVGATIEGQAAKKARVGINRILDDVHNIIYYSGLNTTVTSAPPPAVGGYVRKVDIIINIFNLQSVDLDSDSVFDFIDRAIGIYQDNHRASLLRGYNPFFYLGVLLEGISELPFMAIGKLGFNRKKAESSVLGKLVKGILYLITVIAAFLTILQLLDLLNPVKLFVHEIINSNKADQHG